MLVEDDPIIENQAFIDYLIAKYFTPGQKEKSTEGGEERTPQPAPRSTDNGITDADLLDRAARAKNGAAFRALFHDGDTGAYPSHSEADQALANIFAFWCGPDEGRIDALMRQSALLRSPERLAKWDKIHAHGLTYGQSTIQKAIADAKSFYEPRRKEKRATATPSPVSGDDKRPEILFRPGELSRVVKEAQQALRGRVYQRGGILVDVIRLPREAPYHGIRREEGQTLIRALSMDSLPLLAAQEARWAKFDAKGKPVPINPPKEALQALLGAQGQWTLPPLSGIINCPIMRPDGSILSAPGYDAATRLYADFKPGVFPPVEDSPGELAACDALGTLRDAIAEFPFAEEVDCSVALAALLTAVMRQSVQAAPLFAFSAPTPGTGKSTLCDLVSIIATGKTAPAMDFPPGDEAEFRKMVFAALLEGSPVVLIDNVTSVVNSATLNIVLTQETLKSRILGLSKNAEVPTSALWLIDGNNLRLEGDVTRRTLFCNMDAGVERPAERRFRRDIYPWAKEHRPELVHAALTVLRAFHRAGKPGLADMPAMQGFMDWSNMVRGALRWMGMVDPLKSQRLIEQADPEREALGAVLSAWWAHFGDKPVTVADLIRRGGDEHGTVSDTQAALCQAFSNVIYSGTGVNSRSVGKYLSKYQGRIVDGLRIVSVGSKKKITIWKAERVQAA